MSSQKTTLKEIGSRFGCDEISQHNYHFYYPQFIERFRDRVGDAILKIGVSEGRLLSMWLEYFQNAFVYGFDIGAAKEGPRYEIFKADQSGSNALRVVQKQVTRAIFLIIDDGSYVPEHRALTFDFFFKEVLLPGGVYVIEGIDTSYWTKGEIFGYRKRFGYFDRATIVELSKHLIDDIKAEFLTDSGRNRQDFRSIGWFSEETRNLISTVTFGKNCIFFTKKSEEEFDYYARAYHLDCHL